MEPVRLYYDVCKEIEILELRLSDLEQDLKTAHKLCFTGQLPSDPLPVHVPLDKVLQQYDDVVAKIKEASEQLERKRFVRERLEASIRDLQGIDYQVAYLRDIERLPLAVIAGRLGYTYSHISKISSRIKKAK